MQYLVQMFNPTTLRQAYCLAKLHEATQQAKQNKPNFKPNNQSFSSPNIQTGQDMKVKIPGGGQLTCTETVKKIVGLYMEWSLKQMFT